MEAGTHVSRVTKVTISIPSDLFQWGEEERQRCRTSRSGFVTGLYRERRNEVEEQQRIARYQAAYVRQPVTDEERAWAEAAADALGGE